MGATKRISAKPTWETSETKYAFLFHKAVNFSIINFINWFISMLWHYWYRNFTQEEELFRSFLNDRRQFVRIDTKKSVMRRKPNCGTIQGSKIGGSVFEIFPTKFHCLIGWWTQKYTLKWVGKKLI